MSAAEALKAARAAGIKVGFDGDYLVLEAAVRPPPAVIDLLSRHKAEVLAMLAAIEHERSESKLLATGVSPEEFIQATQGEPGFEQSCAARRGRVEEIDGVLLHFCVECGRFGPYGDCVRLRAGQLGRWYCHKHRPQEAEPVPRLGTIFDDEPTQTPQGGVSQMGGDSISCPESRRSGNFVEYGSE